MVAWRRTSPEDYICTDVALWAPWISCLLCTVTIHPYIVNLVYTIYSHPEFLNYCLLRCFLVSLDSWKVFIFVIAILTQIWPQVPILTTLWCREYNKYKMGVSSSCQQGAFTVASFVLWHLKRSCFSDGLQTCFLLLQPSLLWYLQNAHGKSRDYRNESCKALKTNRHFTCL